jgi:hypothetical protein
MTTVDRVAGARDRPGQPPDQRLSGMSCKSQATSHHPITALKMSRTPISKMCRPQVLASFRSLHTIADAGLTTTHTKLNPSNFLSPHSCPACARLLDFIISASSTLAFFCGPCSLLPPEQSCNEIYLFTSDTTLPTYCLGSSSIWRFGVGVGASQNGFNTPGQQLHEASSPQTNRPRKPRSRSLGRRLHGRLAHYLIMHHNGEYAKRGLAA